MPGSVDLAFVLNAIPALVSYVDRSHRYRFHNDAYSTWFGHDSRDIVGRHMRDVLGDAVYELARPHVEAALAGERVEFETTAPYKDGGTRQIHATYVPDRDADGHVRGLVAVVQDVSAMRVAAQENARLLEAVQRSREAAESANRLKDEFLATVSHELRTPLNAIMGWARMLGLGLLEETARDRAIETIERNAAVQQRLIEDILDVSRIITGKLRLEMQPIDLAAAVYAAVDAVRPSATAKGVDLRLTASAEAMGVIGDSGRLQQVVWNLVSNAIKFTPRGGRVHVALQRRAESAELIVSDTGPGIAADFLPHVFDRFRQGDASTTRSHGGLGLGLAIVRHLTELHGGQVWAESDGEGRGARFTVRFPSVALATGARHGLMLPEADSHDVAPQPPSLEGLSVLLVDDEADTRELFRLVLVQFGAEVRTAGSVREALATLDSWRPDAIVCDIAMPGEDGYSFIGQLRARPAEAGGRIPAAALTAHARTEDRERVLAAGYQLHLAKPVEPYALVSSVQAAAVMTQPVRMGRRRTDRV